MRRIFNSKRDENEKELFKVLQDLGLEPRRGVDVDLYCRHMRGHGLMLEVKTFGKDQRLRPIQTWFKEHFPDNYRVVKDYESLMEAVTK